MFDRLAECQGPSAMNRQRSIRSFKTQFGARELRNVSNRASDFQKLLRLKLVYGLSPLVDKTKFRTLSK